MRLLHEGYIYFLVVLPYSSPRAIVMTSQRMHNAEPRQVLAPISNPQGRPELCPRWVRRLGFIFVPR
jgi:hypothetical protein